MPPREVRLLAGIDAAALADLLAAGAPTRRPVLRLDLAGPGDAAARITGAIDHLARGVAALWPFLWGGEDFSAVRDDGLSHAHLPLRLEALAARVPRVSRAWAKEIVPRLLRRAAPRLAAPSPPLEWQQLALAFAPAGLVVAVPLAPPADAFVAAAEWLARHADVAVLVLAETMPADPPKSASCSVRARSRRRPPSRRTPRRPPPTRRWCSRCPRPTAPRTRKARWS